VEERPHDDRGAGFLGPPPLTDAARRLFDEDLDGDGFVMELTRVWAHRPELHAAVFAAAGAAAEAAALTMRQRAVLVAACASTIGDSYCALGWGTRLATEVGRDVAAAVLAGDDSGLDDEGRALARWARLVARDPAGTSPADVDALRAAGLDDAAIVAATVFVSMRLAFSSVNAALGARPDAELTARAPAEVVAAITYGRPPQAADAERTSVR
jgi:alkylhydroperoxidase family enzyme